MRGIAATMCLMLLAALPVTGHGVESEFDRRLFALELDRTTDLEHAEGLVDAWEGRGYMPYLFLQAEDGRTWYSVRLERHTGRAEAERAKRLIAEAERVPLRIVTEELQKTVDLPERLQRKAEPVHTVRAASFRTPEEAAQEADRMRTAETPALVTTLYGDEGKAWYAVHVGLFDSYAKALELSKKLDSRHHTRTLVFTTDTGFLEERQPALPKVADHIGDHP